MKTIHSLVLIFILLSSVEQYAIAAEDSWNIIPNAAINFKTSDFNISQTAFDPKYTTLNLTLTSTYNKFFISGNFDQSIKDESKFFIDGSQSFIFNATRVDSGLTFGYNIWKSLSVYGGYIYGKTDITLFSQEAILPMTTNPVPNPSEANTSVSFEEEGLFLGTSYGIEFTKGSINLGIGYADLDGEIQFLALNGSNIVPGDTTGFSYAINWTAPLSGTLNYNIGIKIKQFKFKDTRNPKSEDLSFNENFTIFIVGVSNYF